MSHPKHWYLLAALTVMGAAAAPADAQGFGDRLRRAAEEAAKRKVERRVEEKAEEATDATLDRAERSARSATSGTARGAATPTPARDAAAPAARATDAAAGTGAEASPAAVAATPAGVDVGKDFTPGTRVLFATDFAGDEIGDFPRAFTLKEGNAEVADVGGTRYLRATSIGRFEVPLPEVLPERFTVEFDITPVSGWSQYLHFADEEETRPYLMFDVDGGGIESQSGYRVYARLDEARAPNQLVHVQVMSDGRYVKVYMDGQRVANAPNADVGRARKLIVRLKADEEHPVLLGNLRVAAGGKDLYRELAAAGRVTADGILFDTGSDRLRGESAPVLREIADMLAAHPALRLSIEGHTDDLGRAADNQSLSARRAEAVRAYLVARHGVDADRLAAQGFGATKPVAPNADEAGRQRNRRVELVRR